MAFSPADFGFVGEFLEAPDFFAVSVAGAFFAGALGAADFLGADAGLAARVFEPEIPEELAALLGAADFFLPALFSITIFSLVRKNIRFVSSRFWRSKTFFHRFRKNANFF
ncbi:MAG: hypothetical protein LBK27_00870 [Treponema sp.]|nr:hypothetical protein [Treponema sp.]